MSKYKIIKNYSIEKQLFKFFYNLYDEIKSQSSISSRAEDIGN